MANYCKLSLMRSAYEDFSKETKGWSERAIMFVHAGRWDKTVLATVLVHTTLARWHSMEEQPHVTVSCQIQSDMTACM